jgi:uncharacterized protein YjbJ (UPF0337 family)
MSTSTAVASHVPSEPEHPITSGVSHITRKVPLSDLAAQDEQQSSGTKPLTSYREVVFIVSQTGQRLTLPEKPVIVLGREETTSREYSHHIDLSAFGAFEHGVSCRHVVLHRMPGSVWIGDLNISNGTYLNGIRLIPNSSSMLRDGDRIALSRLIFYVEFQQRTAIGTFRWLEAVAGKVRKWWGKLTDDALENVAGERDKLVGKIPERYGIAKEEAASQVDNWSSGLHL